MHVRLDEAQGIFVSVRACMSVCVRVCECVRPCMAWSVWHCVKAFSADVAVALCGATFLARLLLALFLDAWAWGDDCGGAPTLTTHEALPGITFGVNR